MREWGRVSVCGLLLCVFGLPTGYATARLEAYGRLPSLEDVALSPDGRELAFVRATGDTRAVVIMSLGEHKVLGGARLGEIKLRYLTWADSDHLLIVTSDTGVRWGFSGESQEWYLLTVYEVSTRKLKAYPTYLPGLNMMNVVAGRIMVRHIGGDTYLFIPGIYLSGGRHKALFKVNLRTGAESALRLGSDATRGWLVDANGEIVAETNYYEQDQQWQLKIRRQGQLVEVQSRQVPIDLPQILGFGPAGDSLLVQDIEDGDPVWRLVSLQDGKLGPPMAERAVMSEPIEDPNTHRMIGGVQVVDEADYVFFDRDLRNRWASIRHAFDGERLKLVSTSADLTKFVVRVEGPKHGYQYQLVDMNQARAISLGKVYDDVDEAMEVRRISYPAADGMKIPAYLTLPSGRSPSRLPLLVFPHGGPAARDTGDFNWWAQAMASQGYAVLQPNYRGSALNWSVVSAGFGEWGRKMQTDLSDGVRYLDKQGIIDPKRVCIVGASYGGYAALAGVTLDPGVYRCAVSVAGISDLKSFLVWVRRRESAGDHIAQRYWDRFMGVQNYKDLTLDTISPIRHIESLDVPVLLIHGHDDTVVPYEQSNAMFGALRKAHKDAQLVTLKKEDHWLSRSETRLQMLQSAMEFIRANNPPDQAPSDLQSADSPQSADRPRAVGSHPAGDSPQASNNPAPPPTRYSAIR